MEQQSFSHGLLYSVAPEHFAELHLRNEESTDEVEWEKHEYPFAVISLRQTILSFLRITATRLTFRH